MIILFICIVLLITAFISKAFMDLSSEDKFDSVYWNKGRTWVLKYKFPLKEGKRTWYYLWLYKPKYEERFMYSTTILSFTTDGWHLLQLIFLNSIFIVMSILAGSNIFSVVIVYIFIRILYSIFFNVFYNEYSKNNK